MGTWHNDTRAHLSEQMKGHEKMIRGWVLLYETTGMDDDGDLTGSWGAIYSATSPTIVGLCELAIERIKRDDD